MTQKILNIAFGVGILVVGFLAFQFGGNSAYGATGATYEALIKWFGNGLTAGSSEQLVINKDGYLDTSGQVRSTATSTTLNGVTTWQLRTALSTGTTTPCVLETPATATTSLQMTNISATGSTTASTITMATSTAGYATTTLLQQFGFAANAQGAFGFIPTTTDKMILAPGTKLVFGQSGGTGTFSGSGACTATVRSVS